MWCSRDADSIHFVIFPSLTKAIQCCCRRRRIPRNPVSIAWVWNQSDTHHVYMHSTKAARESGHQRVCGSRRSMAIIWEWELSFRTLTLCFSSKPTLQLKWLSSLGTCFTWLHLKAQSKAFRSGLTMSLVLCLTAFRCATSHWCASIMSYGFQVYHIPLICLLSFICLVCSSWNPIGHSFLC